MKYSGSIFFYNKEVIIMQKELKNVEKRKRNLILSVMQSMLEEEVYDILTNGKFKDVADLDAQVDTLFRQYWDSSDAIAEFYAPKIEQESDESDEEDS